MAKRSGIGTGRIISTYFRPQPETIDKDDLDARLKRFGGKQIGPNMWLIETTKSYMLPKTAITLVAIRQLGKYYIYTIPTDKKGNISQINMAERLLDTDSGDRHGAPRNVMIDVGIDALQIHDPKDQERIYRWWLYPNETDVKKIDDSRTMIAEILGKGQKWGRCKVLIVGGTNEQREKIAADLTANFTVREKQIINNCLIEIVSDNKSYAGCFQGNTDSQGNIIGTPKINVTSSSVKNSDVIIHEAVHALRQFDQSRDPKLKAVKNYWGKDADLEESLTDGETTARQRPFQRDDYHSGYYHYIKIPKLPVSPTEEEVDAEARKAWDKYDSDYRRQKLVNLYHIPKGKAKDNAAKEWKDLDSDVKDLLSKKTKEIMISRSEEGNKSSSEMLVEDRITITGSKEKGQKGKRVQKSLIMKYPMTNISHLKLKGTAEAIDTFREMERTLSAGGNEVTTHVQMYKPNATGKTDRIQDQALKEESPGEIRQFEDGRSTLVRKDVSSRFRRPKPRKVKTASGSSKKVGPYFSRGGRLSRHRV